MVSEGDLPDVVVVYCGSCEKSLFRMMYSGRDYREQSLSHFLGWSRY